MGIVTPGQKNIGLEGDSEVTCSAGDMERSRLSGQLWSMLNGVKSLMNACPVFARNPDGAASRRHAQ